MLWHDPFPLLSENFVHFIKSAKIQQEIKKNLKQNLELKKMKRLKIKRLVLAVIVITVILSFIPAAAANREKRKTTIRPIEDWLAAVPAGNPPLGGMPYWDEGLGVWTLLDDLSPIPHWDSPMNYDPKGFVLERELKDNTLLVSVNMHIKGVPFYILTLAPSIPEAIPIFSGVMDFIYGLKFTIDLDTLGPEDYDDDGNIIYHPWNYYVFALRSLVSVFLCAHGSGTFLNSYDGWEEGDTAKMNTINFMVVVGEDYTGPNLYYNFLGLFEIVLGNNINFH